MQLIQVQLPVTNHNFVVIPILNPSTDCTSFCRPFYIYRIIWVCMDKKIKVHKFKSIGRSILKKLRSKSKLLYHLANRLTSVSSFSASVLMDLWDRRLADVYLSVNQMFGNLNTKLESTKQAYTHLIWMITFSHYVLLVPKA